MDEVSLTFYSMYALVRNQVRISSMGDIIDLDYNAVLDVIALYFPVERVKEVFEYVLQCFRIEQELR